MSPLRMPVPHLHHDDEQFSAVPVERRLWGCGHAALSVADRRLRIGPHFGKRRLCEQTLRCDPSSSEMQVSRCANYKVKHEVAAGSYLVSRDGRERAPALER